MSRIAVNIDDSIKTTPLKWLSITQIETPSLRAEMNFSVAHSLPQSLNLVTSEVPQMNSLITEACIGPGKDFSRSQQDYDSNGAPYPIPSLRPPTDRGFNYHIPLIDSAIPGDWLNRAIGLCGMLANISTPFWSMLQKKIFNRSRQLDCRVAIST